VNRLAILGGIPAFSDWQLLIKPSMPPLSAISERLRQIHDSVFITNGRFNRLLEDTFCKQMNVSHAVSASNATIGLMLALKALAQNGRDEVILPSFTFAATGLSVLWNGLKPVFADIDPNTKNLDPAKVIPLITDRTLAIMPVYIFSNPPDIEAFDRISVQYGIPIIYDAAQGMGSSYHGQPAGSFGDIEVFSLAPTKIVTAVEGAIISTRNPSLANELRVLRDMGKTGEYDFDEMGLNARMTEYQAVIALYNLERLDIYLKHRRELVQIYQQNLKDIPGLSFQSITPASQSGYNYMVLFIDPDLFGLSRDQLNDILCVENIQTKKYFYPALHFMKPFQKFCSINLIETERTADSGLALPLYNTLDPDVVLRICALIADVYENRTELQSFFNQRGTR